MKRSLPGISSFHPLARYPWFVLVLGLLLFPFSVIGETAQFETREQVEVAIAKYGRLIELEVDLAQNHLKRADAYFLLNDFDMAIKDYTAAIKLNDYLDLAYYGRGLAYGRRRLIDEGIADLDVFIQRNPGSSLGYTKRGVRYLWKEDLENAEKDLEKAISLDPNNAEAHDDLGVVYSQKGNYTKAIGHFILTVAIDSTYQKGYHNLAMSLYVMGKDHSALNVINESLKLKPDSQNSIRLKGLILKSLGRIEEAEQLLEDAEFMPEGNWSERIAMSSSSVTPDLILAGLDSKQYRFDNYLNQGKWVVLNIWGPKCPPCIEEMPQLQAFHDEHIDKDAMVVGLAIDYPSFGYAKPDEVEEFLELNEISYPILLGDADIVQGFGAGPLPGVPMTLIYSPKGKLSGKWIGQVTAEQLEKFIYDEQVNTFQ